MLSSSCTKFFLMDDNREDACSDCEDEHRHEHTGCADPGEPTKASECSNTGENEADDCRYRNKDGRTSSVS